MPADHPEQEPSIEEILASIRQIISDDDEGEGESAPDPVEEEPMEEAALPEDEDDDVLELTEKIEDEPEPEPAPPREEPRKVVIDLQDHVEDPGTGILTDTAETAAMAGFSKLASRALLDRRGTGDTTVEDIVRELMRPMLREWLDIHLPPLIEKVVKQELREVARRAMEGE